MAGVAPTIPGMSAGEERWNPGTSEGRAMTTLLRREARVAGGALTGVGDTTIPTATAAIHGRTGAGPVTLRASRIAPIDLDPTSDIADSSRLPGLGAGCWAWQEHAACKGMDSSRFFPPEREPVSYTHLTLPTKR